MSARQGERSAPLGPGLLALVLVAVTGVACLAMPFTGDQAYLTVYGRQLSEGAVLYRDVFDVKQPGIFVFYAVGGLLFGFTEVGIHLLELGYWLAFSAFMVVALPRYFSTPWAAPLVPIFTVVVYYLYARPYDLTQNEMLVAFPLLVVWWLLDQADARTRRGIARYAAAGLVAAAVVMLKYLYLLIVLGFLGYAVVRAYRARVRSRDVGRAVAAFSVGVGVPLLLVGVYFAAYGQLERIWWAYFELAPGGTALAPRHLGRLTGGATTFLLGHAPVVVLAVVGVVHTLRRRVRPQTNLVAAMVLWGAIGAVLFLVQFWLAYHWLLFNVPLGILAVVGVEALVDSRRLPDGRRRWVTLAGVAALAALSFWIGAPADQTLILLLVLVVITAGAGIGLEMVGGRAAGGWLVPLLAAGLAVSLGLMAATPAHKLTVLGQHDFALTTESRAEFRHAWYSPYRAADQDLDVLRSGEVLPGAMFVFGNPVVLLRANRPQAVPLSGWFSEIYDSRAWHQIERDLRSATPPYIVIEEPLEALIRSRHPALMGFVEEEYTIAFVGASGTWHVHR